MTDLPLVQIAKIAESDFPFPGKAFGGQQSGPRRTATYNVR
jgi:hypothetical protein